MGLVFDLLIGLTALVLLALAWELLQIWRAQAPQAEHVHQQLVGTADPLPDAQHIPRIIWSYWHAETVPAFVAQCQANWRRYSPAHEVRMLHRGSLAQWLGEEGLLAAFDQLPPFRQADWLRLQLLARHGGIWVDATIILTESLDWVHRLQRQQASEYVGFYLHGFSNRPDQPMLENWFIAAVPGSPFIQAWATALERALSLGETGYRKALAAEQRLARVAQKLPPGMQDYLVMHLAAADVLDRDARGFRLHLLRAEDSALSLHAALRWRKRHLYARLALTPCPARLPALIKIRGVDRRVLERGLARDWWLRSSLLGQFLLPRP